MLPDKPYYIVRRGFYRTKYYSCFGMNSITYKIEKPYKKTMFKLLKKGDKVNIIFENETVIGEKVGATDNRIYIKCSPPNSKQRIYVFNEDTGLRPTSPSIRLEPDEETLKKGIEKYKSLIIKTIDDYDDWRGVIALYKKTLEGLT